MSGLDLNEKILKIKQIRENVDDIYGEILQKANLSVGVDDRRTAFFLSELDSLVTILTLLESRAYKESLILTRTVFEKFLYFWLMISGKKYRHNMTHRIIPKESPSEKEARNRTLEKWQELKKCDSPAFASVLNMQPGKKDDEILVTYEYTGLMHAGDKLALTPPIPYYNFILYEYDHEVGHLGDLPSMMEGDMFPDILRKESKNHKQIYNQFFYFDNVIRNLKINDLITEIERERILVHYNFLSGFVHPGKYSLEVWNSFSSKLISTPTIEEHIIQKLIFLYVSKLMHLFFKTMIGHYNGKNPHFDGDKYKSSIQDLEKYSEELWFFDNEPTEYDVKASEKRKQAVQTFTGKQGTVDMLYYKNPLTRLENLLKFQQYGVVNT